MIMDKIISFVLAQLNIYNLSSLVNKWQSALDWFFYFAKAGGHRVPSFEEVRSYLKVRY